MILFETNITLNQELKKMKKKQFHILTDILISLDWGLEMKEIELS